VASPAAFVVGGLVLAGDEDAFAEHHCELDAEAVAFIGFDSPGVAFHLERGIRNVVPVEVIHARRLRGRCPEHCCADRSPNNSSPNPAKPNPNRIHSILRLIRCVVGTRRTGPLQYSGATGTPQMACGPGGGHKKGTESVPLFVPEENVRQFAALAALTLGVYSGPGWRSKYSASALMSASVRAAACGVITGSLRLPAR
jgi:hypothetical protein